MMGGPWSSSTQPTRIDRWFLTQFAELAELRRAAGVVDWREMSPDLLQALKRAGFGDDELGAIAGVDAQSVTARRREEKLGPVFKRIDTCAAEFESFTPYMYGTYETECEADPTRSADGRHPRQRTEPDRARDRVRLLLLSRGVRAA